MKLLKIRLLGSLTANGKADDPTDQHKKCGSKQCFHTAENYMLLTFGSATKFLDCLAEMSIAVAEYRLRKTVENEYPESKS